MNEQQRIEALFEHGLLVNKDLLDKNIDPALLERVDVDQDLLVLNSDYVDLLSQQTNLVDWREIDASRVEAEKGRDEELYQAQLQQFRNASLVLQTPRFSRKQELTSIETALDADSAFEDQFETAPLNKISSLTAIDPLILTGAPVSIIVSHEGNPHKYEVKDFVNFFLSRYRFLENILRHRQELENVLTINRVLSKKEKEKVSVIGLINDINPTKNDNLVLTLEDPTGTIKVIVSKNKTELFHLAKELTYDEVVGITGISGDKIIFSENIVWPDIPTSHELKKGEAEESLIFLSDIHVGSSLFLKEEFGRFLSWIRGETGNETQRSLAASVKYIVIAGDLVDGVGIYPSQEEELNIFSYKEQYAEFCRLIKQIPPDKKLIVCPGNHDAVHLAEPQSVFYREYAPELFQLPNITIVSNPAYINVGKTKEFSGFDILMYHGYSFDYHINSIEALRNNGGYHRADLMMRYLLKRRHLAPSFKSTPYFPAYSEDPLIINKIPDFFVTGHIHYSKVANYKGVTMICGSCWQGKTSFQEKLGHEPEPARVPLVNLKTREVKILRFM